MAHETMEGVSTVTVRQPPRDRPDRHRRYTGRKQAFRRVVAVPIGYSIIAYVSVTQRVVDVAKALLQVLRLLRFAGVGVGVAILGYGVLYVTVNVMGLPSLVAYLVEGSTSVEANFLGSRYITWLDRVKETAFWRTWRQFHVARGITFCINQVLFNLQVLLLFRTWPGFFHFTYHGFYYGYMVANTACILVSMSFNYTANDQFVFAGKALEPSEAPTLEIASSRVGVMVPCKNNPDLGLTVAAVLNQTYVAMNPNNIQIALVGNQNEPSWASVVNLPEPAWWSAFGNLPPFTEWAERSIHFIEAQVHYTPGRDANIKRVRGLAFLLTRLDTTLNALRRGDKERHTWLRGEQDIVWWLDADVLPPPDLLAQYVNRIAVQGYEIVGGPAPSRPQDRGHFWPLFIDTAGGKMPNWSHPWLLTIANLGLNKAPVTANVAMRADVARTAYPAEDQVFSLEDYELFFRHLRNGRKILCDPALAAPREHRVGFWNLAREYYRSGRGSRDYIVRHPRNNLFRVWQLFRLNAVPIGLAAVITGLVMQPALTLVLGCAMVLSRMLGTGLRALRAWDPKGSAGFWRKAAQFCKYLSYGMVYPFITGFFALCAWYGNCWEFFRQGLRHPRRPLVARSTGTLRYSQVVARVRGGNLDASQA